MFATAVAMLATAPCYAAERLADGVCSYWALPNGCTPSDLADKGSRMGAKGYVPDGTPLGGDVVGGKGSKPRPDRPMRPIEKPLPPASRQVTEPNITPLGTTAVTSFLGWSFH